MILETEIDIAAPPTKVWRTLSEFGAYPRWHPHWEIEGVPVQGARLYIRIGSNPEKRMRVRARVIGMAPGEEVAFRSGPFFARSYEYFRLEPSKRGTLLRHTNEITGLAALQFKFKEEYEKLVRIYDFRLEALAKYVTTSTPLKAVARSRPRTRI
ncbi:MULTISPECIES: SRPBCC family protein [Caulobacter]|jgi:uncharacterized protein YndB with AHSA1/START domain|uniref:Polyketide cyclase / dehydrase and lipid transport n=1 Tax=Caulobacter vibrioides OR37 TaxID=1292034 RepID=R0EBL3_CAUVI|nr:MULTISPECIES: SRPBCC family protein [Caulobacter]ENZ82868.1 hypothetical protein OR37_01062 [Caulobacter vibrioides OR37]PIB96902.1 hypothetical protein CSW60_20685 [Caulobacter sp. X]